MKQKVKKQIAQVILFEHANFHGQHKHVFRQENNLNAADDNFFNDKVSSMVVLDGHWEFFKDSNLIAKLGPTLAPGSYPSVQAALGAGSNDQISSLRPV